MESVSFHAVTGISCTEPSRLDITGESRCVTTARLVIRHAGHDGAIEATEIVLFANGDTPAALHIQQPSVGAKEVEA